MSSHTRHVGAWLRYGRRTADELEDTSTQLTSGGAWSNGISVTDGAGPRLTESGGPHGSENVC